MSKFEFNQKNTEEIEKILKKYPENKKRSAVMDLLFMAQKQNNNHLTIEAMNRVAEILELAPIRVYEIANFYTMYNLKPVGENFIQICTTTPCWLRGSDEIVTACKEKLSVDAKTMTDDGKFSYMEVECLGGCVNAPIVQINDDYYEDLNKDLMIKLIENLQSNNKLLPGSQIGRKCSAPIHD